MRALPLLLLLCGCGDDPRLAPVIDLPPASSAAFPYTDLDTLELSIAHASQEQAIASVAVGPGETPALGPIAFADDLVVHLVGRRTGLDVAYGRTCAVAVSEDSPPLTPHLYFARIVKWAPAPAPVAPARTGGVAYATPDGSAVFVGGDAEPRLERFDAGRGTFVGLAGRVSPRRGAVLAPLPDGRALRLGGVGDGATAIPGFELVSPLAADALQVQAVADDRLRLAGHAAATLTNGDVVVIGGGLEQTPGVFVTSGATWLFEPAAADVPEPPRRLAAALAVARRDHSATRLGDEVGASVLVVGGQDGAGAPIGTAEIYEPLREAYADFRPAMVRPRYGHRAIRLPDGSVLVVGGRDAAGPVDVVEIYRSRVGQFLAAATLPAGAGVTEQTVVGLADGRVLLVGGLDRDGTPVATTLIARLDPVDGTVDLSPTDTMALPRAGHAAARLCDGTILVAGGTSAAGPGAERYNPPPAGRR